jgi:predicted transcriptional regulator of viral defense system
MANRSRLQIAKSDIVALFNGMPTRVFKSKQIGEILSEHRASWRLAQNTTTADFIAFLGKSGDLKEISLAFPNRGEILYVWGSVPMMEMLLHVKAKSYFSNYTAMRMHGLTKQVPTSIYISHERLHATPRSSINQVNVDRAFARPPRTSQNFSVLDDRRIILLNSASTNNLGVVEQKVRYTADEESLVRLTNIERTLIDAVVRPWYCGGAVEVSKAFELAKEEVSINALSAMLKKLDYVYPYHQAIGYYMERAGYRASQLDLLRRFPMQLDFYLSHEMPNTTYVQDWKLHIPADL